MGIRFFYFLLVFSVLNINSSTEFLSIVQGSSDPLDPLFMEEQQGDIGDADDFSDLSDTDNPVITHDVDQVTGSEDPQGKLTNRKIDLTLAKFKTLEKADQYNLNLKSQEQSWAAAQKKSSIFSSGPAFDFTLTDGLTNATNPVESLMLSAVAALKFCNGKSSPEKRKVIYRTIGSGGSLQPFKLPAITTASATCATLRQNFCNNVCTRGFCGADPLYGATCVRACWGEEFRTNPKLQACHQDFDMRFVNNTGNSALNPCAIERAQIERQGTLAKLKAKASGKLQSLDLADKCATVLSTTNATVLGSMGVLCANVLKTCNLNAMDRQTLATLMQQFQITGVVPTAASPNLQLLAQMRGLSLGANPYGAMGMMPAMPGMPMPTMQMPMQMMPGMSMPMMPGMPAMSMPSMQMMPAMQNPYGAMPMQNPYGGMQPMGMGGGQGGQYGQNGNQGGNYGGNQGGGQYGQNGGQGGGYGGNQGGGQYGQGGNQGGGYGGNQGGGQYGQNGGQGGGYGQNGGQSNGYGGNQGGGQQYDQSGNPIGGGQGGSQQYDQNGNPIGGGQGGGQQYDQNGNPIGGGNSGNSNCDPLSPLGC